MSTEIELFDAVADAPKIQVTEQIKKSEVSAPVPAVKQKAQVADKALIADKVSTNATPKRDFAAEYDAQVGNVNITTNTIFPEIKPIIGFEHYWAAMYSTKGEYDGANMQKKKAKGWVIRPLESIEDYDWKVDERNVSGDFGGLTVNNHVLMHRKITVGDQVRKQKMEETAKRGYEELNSARKKGGLSLDVESENNARVGGRKVTPADDE